MTGGSGLLGTALRALDSEIIAPAHSELDITVPQSVLTHINEHKPDIFFHAGAFTSPPKCDAEPQQALQNNIIGTANVVAACIETGTKLIYVSTDYVFKGDTGNYREADELLPQNKYAWSKLGGECAVRMYDNSLIIRTSFYPDEFPYEAGFVDQFTSRDGVSVIAELIYQVICLNQDITSPVIHVGTERKSVKELALKLGKTDVKDLRRNEVNFITPEDTSLNTELLNSHLK